jgi:hypothetical protein
MCESREWLWGAFGSYIKEAAAGPAGNGALRGARMLLLTPTHRDALLELAFTPVSFRLPGASI